MPLQAPADHAVALQSLLETFLAGTGGWTFRALPWQDPAGLVLPVRPDPAGLALPAWLLESIEGAVRTATGPVGLAVVFVYSFLIAFVLPLPSEVVLAAPLEIGLPETVEVGILALVSATGKTVGSVVAFSLGRGIRESGPVVRLLRRSRFDVVAWSERKTVELARAHGHLGLALALMVPGFPDTLSIYAFSALGEEYDKFAAATFAGSLGRLLVTVALVGGAFVVV